MKHTPRSPARPALVALAWIVLPLACAASQDPSSPAPPSRPPVTPPATTPVPAGSAPSAAGTQLLPFSLDKEHRYSWILERQKVGETTFRVSEVEAPPGSPAGKVFRVSTRFRYEKEGVLLEGDQEAWFDRSFRPLRYRSELRYSGLNNYRSRQVQEGKLEGGRLSYTVVHNGRTDDPVYQEFPVPADAWLFLNQAIEQWAILASRVLAGAETVETRVIYPDHLRVFDVTFRSEKEDAVERAAGRKTPCRLYSFRSREGQLEGKVWMDREGRMVQYQQGLLRIFLEE